MEVADIAERLAHLDRGTNLSYLTAKEARYVGGGRTKPWNILASDGLHYIVKVRNNPIEEAARRLLPQAPLKILTTELICGRLGQLFTQPMCPPVAIVAIPPEVASVCRWPDTGELIAAGPAFGSRVVSDAADAKTEPRHIEHVSPELAARLVVFQTWLYGDDPSALIAPDGSKVWSIDHGYYLTGTAWSDPLPTVLKSYAASDRLCLLSNEWRGNGYWRDGRCFCDVLDELMGLSEDDIIQSFAGFPREWGVSHAFMADLAYFVLARRSTVRDRLKTLTSGQAVWP
jgi:hypothetical protein